MNAWLPRRHGLWSGRYRQQASGKWPSINNKSPYTMNSMIWLEPICTADQTYTPPTSTSQQADSRKLITHDMFRTHQQNPMWASPGWPMANEIYWL